MGRPRCPGPRSLAGLAWIDRLGASPLEPWALAMGWGQRAAYSHARRLVDAGLLRGDSMTRGHGTLFAVTPAGSSAVARSNGVTTLGGVASTSPTSWAHYVASAWVAAWFDRRGRAWVGEREMRRDGGWAGSIVVAPNGGVPQRRSHSPDFGVWLDDTPLAVEVELQPKPVDRWRAILGMYAARSRPDLVSEVPDLGGVIYVVRTSQIAAKVQRIALDLRLGDAFALRALEDIQAQTRAAAS